MPLLYATGCREEVAPSEEIAPTRYGCYLSLLLKRPGGVFEASVPATLPYHNDRDVHPSQLLLRVAILAPGGRDSQPCVDCGKDNCRLRRLSDALDDRHALEVVRRGGRGANALPVRFLIWLRKQTDVLIATRAATQNTTCLGRGMDI